MPFYKTILITFLFALCYSLSAQTTNIDSLKLELAKSNPNRNDCDIVFDIFTHYNTTNILDSINVYAIYALNVCNLNVKADRYIIELIIGEQYKQGLSENTTLTIDSLITEIKDSDRKLYFLVLVAQNLSTYSEDQDQFEKYWRQAQLALSNAKEDYALFKYYTFLGLKNVRDRNLIAALQSIKIAATYKNIDPEESLRNEFDLAYMYVRIADYDKAIQLALKISEKAEELNDVTKVMYVHYLLMDCYVLVGNYEEAIKTAEASINYSRKHNFDTALGFSYSVLGAAYLGLANVATEERTPSDIDYSVENILITNYLDSAKYYLDTGVQYSLEHHESKELADNYRVLSEYYDRLGDNEKAKTYLKKAQSEQTYAYDIEIDRRLAEIWAKEKNYSKAYHHLQNYTDLMRNEVNRTEDVQLGFEIIENSYKYKEESEARILNSKQKEKRLANLIACAIAGLILSAILLFFIQKNRNKLKQLNNHIANRNKELDILISKQKETIKYLDNFASVAAHDLKAPIRTASSFASLLTKKFGDKQTEKEKEYLKYIGSSVSQLSEMIDDLLSLSRLDANLPELKEIDLNEIVIEVKILLSNLLNQTGSKIIVESSLPKVTGHSTLLSQLFQNIIKNAIVHNKTGKNTIIKINSSLPINNKLTIQVTDNSGGIPEYIVPKLFELFSSSDKNTGNGIGLATCKKIVNHYGGDIWVDINPGVGTTFKFHLFKGGRLIT